MNRFLSTVFCGLFSLLLLTLSACDPPPVVEIPGDAPKSEPSPDNASAKDTTNGEKPVANTEAPVDPFQAMEIPEELLNLAKLPEDRSPASLLAFLKQGSEQAPRLEMFAKLMPPEKTMQLQKDILNAWDEAADLILLDEKSLDEHTDTALHTKQMSVYIATMQSDPSILEKIRELGEKIEKAGNKQLLWQIEILYLQTENQFLQRGVKSQEDLDAAQARFGEIAAQALAKLQSGKELGTLTEDNLPFFQELIFVWNEILKFSPEGEKAVNSLLEVLAGLEPNDKLSKNAIENLTLQSKIQYKFGLFASKLAERTPGTPPETADFDATLADVSTLTEKALEDKITLTPLSVNMLLAFLSQMETLATRENVAAFYSVIDSAVRDCDLPEKEQLTALVEGIIRGFNLPGNEMKFQAVQADGTKVSMKNFEGKVVILDVLSLNQQNFMMDIADLQKIYEAYKDSGVEIVWYCAGGRSQDLMQLQQFLQLPWVLTVPDVNADPSADPTADLVGYYGINSMPKIFLIGTDGKVISTDIYGQKLFDELKKLFPDVEIKQEPMPELESLEEDLDSDTQPLPPPDDAKPVVAPETEAATATETPEPETAAEGEAPEAVEPPAVEEPVAEETPAAVEETAEETAEEATVEEAAPPSEALTE